MHIAPLTHVHVHARAHGVSLDALIILGGSVHITYTTMLYVLYSSRETCHHQIFFWEYVTIILYSLEATPTVNNAQHPIIWVESSSSS